MSMCTIKSVVTSMNNEVANLKFWKPNLMRFVLNREKPWVLVSIHKMPSKVDKHSQDIEDV